MDSHLIIANDSSGVGKPLAMRDPVMWSIVAMVLLSVTSPVRGNVLTNWLDTATTVIQVVEDDYSLVGPGKPITKKTTDYNDVVLIDQTGKVISARGKAGSQFSSVLFVFGNGSTKEQYVDKNTKTDTDYLPADKNKASFKLLQAKNGSMFITSVLTGCDVWIADRMGVQPLVVHVNAYQYSGDPVRQLTYMEGLATEALNYFNDKITQNYYKYIMRVSSDFAGQYPSDRDKINDYWNQFSRKNIPHVLYDASNPALLYGTLNAPQNIEWYFRLKDLIHGRLMLRMNCNDNANACTIQ